MSLFLMLIAAAGLPVLIRTAGMIVRLLIGLIGGFVVLAAVIVVLLVLTTHVKLP
jgi:hypothetical protein